MAVFPAGFSVRVTCEPGEVRPKDDQAIVLNIQREIPNLQYALELNKHINDEKSFLYIYRISRERLCVVLRNAEQATKLVEDVGKITVNNIESEIKYLVPKAVKVNISNAGYGVTNSTLKKFLTNHCKIQTLSSVSEQKANIDREGALFQDSMTSRRIVYISPYDVEKLPSGPIKFTTLASNSWVFFDVESPKCHLCSAVGHFRKDCPKNSENSENQVSDNVNKNTNSADVKPNSENSDVTDKVNKDSCASDSESENSIEFSPFSSASQNEMETQTSESSQQSYAAAVVNKPKRRRSLNSSTSASSDTSKANFETPPFQSFKTPSRPNPKLSKKMRVEGNKSVQDRLVKLSESLQPAREHVNKTKESHGLSFNQVVQLHSIMRTTPLEERVKFVDSITEKKAELITLLDSIYEKVSGKGIRAKITLLKKTCENTDPLDPESDTSIFSDSEAPENSQELSQ